MKFVSDWRNNIFRSGTENNYNCMYNVLMMCATVYNVLLRENRKIELLLLLPQKCGWHMWSCRSDLMRNNNNKKNIYNIYI